MFFYHMHVSNKKLCYELVIASAQMCTECTVQVSYMKKHDRLIILYMHGNRYSVYFQLPCPALFFSFPSSFFLSLSSTMFVLLNGPVIVLFCKFSKNVILINIFWVFVVHFLLQEWLCRVQQMKIMYCTHIAWPSKPQVLRLYIFTFRSWVHRSEKYISL